MVGNPAKQLTLCQSLTWPHKSTVSMQVKLFHTEEHQRAAVVPGPPSPVRPHPAAPSGISHDRMGSATACPSLCTTTGPEQRSQRGGKLGSVRTMQSGHGPWSWPQPWLEPRCSCGDSEQGHAVEAPLGEQYVANVI